jgi:copper resistance protein D
MNGLIVAARFVHFAAVALLFGLPLFRLTVAATMSGDSLRMRFDAGLWRICRAAALLAFLSALGWFAGVVADMTGSWAELIEPDSIATVAFDTRFGNLWTGRLAVMVLAIVLLAQAVPLQSARPHVLLAITAGVLATSLIGVGHAAVGPGALSNVHLAADAVHLLCASAWIGGLAGLLLLTRTSSAGTTLAGALPAFTRMATVAVMGLLLTGIINSVLLLDSVAALVETSYGRILVVKIALAAAMLVLAAYNRFVLSPGIRKGRPESAATLSRTVIAEIVFGAAVLASVAVLGTVHPVL